MRRQRRSIVRGALLAALALHRTALGDDATFLDLGELASTADVSLQTAAIDCGADDDQGTLAGGWGIPEKMGDPKQPVGARWVVGTSATAMATSVVSRTRQIRFLAMGYQCPVCPAEQEVTISVGGRTAGRVTLPVGRWVWRAVDAPADAWHLGDNAIAFSMAWSRSPRDSDPRSTDQRQLSLAMSRIEIQDRISGNLAPPSPPNQGFRAIGADHASVTLRGEGAMTYYLRLPDGAALDFSAGKADDAPRGDGFALKVWIEADGRAPGLLLARAFPGLTHGSETHHRLDLSAYAGEVVRIVMAISPGDEGRTRGDACRIGSPRIVAPRFTGWERFEATASTVYVPPVGLRSPPRTDHPNAIIYLMDALRARALGCYGAPEPTSPHIDRMSRRGALLSENYSQAPNTPPSVKAILTGTYLPSIGHAKLPDDARTIGEVFLDTHAYRTAAFSNSPFVHSDTQGLAQGFETLDPKLQIDPDQTNAAEPPLKDYCMRLALAFRRWLDEAGDSAYPFFAYFHSVHPHNPYAPIAPWNRLLTEPGLHGRYDGTTLTLFGIQHGRIAVDRDAVAGYHQLLYKEDLAYNDWVLGTAFADLARRGRLDDTIFTIIADHGEEFLEHDGILHGYTAFDEMLNTPVVLAGPGLPRDTIVRGMTQSIDLAPTILDLCSLGEGRMQGRTVWPLVSGKDEAEPEVFASASSVGAIYSLRGERWKYVYAPRHEEGGKEHGHGVGNSIGRKLELQYLYDLAADPEEKANIFDKHPILGRFLHQRLMSWLKAVDTMRVTSGAPPPPCGMPCDECKGLVALGYIAAGSCVCCCEDVRSLWSRGAKGMLSGNERATFLEQMKCCPECKAEFEAAKAAGTL
ncbi:MAG: sulfatase [Acidobacteriota bacterium]